MFNWGRPPYNYGLLVAKGEITGSTGLNIFGRNPDVDSGTLPEDLWSQGGVWVPPTQARVHNIKSSDATDGTGLAGARTITITGLNASYNQVTESINLNGLSDVATVNSYIFISHMLVTTAGATGTNAGIITATAQTDGTVTNAIAAGYGNDAFGIYQIPAGYTGYLTRWQASMQQNVASSSANVNLLIKPFGGIYSINGIHGLNNSGNANEEDVFDFPIQLAAKTIVKIQITSATNNNTDVQGRMQINLVAD